MFRWLTAGESHGPQLITILDGMPAGFSIDQDAINYQMHRRQGGYGRGKRQQIETDSAMIQSGVRHGYTLGSPIAMLIGNKDWENWSEVMSIMPPPGLVDENVVGAQGSGGMTGTKKVTRLRPGHADFAGVMKYGFDDVRNILERSSARSTASMVAVGAVARQCLEKFGIHVHSFVASAGTIQSEPYIPGETDWEAVEASPVRTIGKEVEAHMIAAVDEVKEAGNTLGGIITVLAEGVPVGLGSVMQWDRRIDGLLGQIMLSIPACKGVDIGDGFASTRMPGSEVHDVIQYDGERGWHHRTNHAGGIEGGMTNGEPVVVHAAIKPISTMKKPLPSVDLATRQPIQAHYERSDVFVLPAAGVIGEACMAIVLWTCFLDKFGGDSYTEIKRSYDSYMAGIRPK